MSLYVIGPVTGRPDLNRAAFAGARAKLAAAGYNVRIPHDFIPADATHGRAMRMSLQWILNHADGLALLPGWQGSVGASLEHAVAFQCGVPCISVDAWAKLPEKGGI